MSTGGGFFKVKNLNRLGRVVYLHSSVEAILEAISNHAKAKKKIKKRPLLKDPDRARELFNERLPQYRRVADHEVLLEGRGIAEIAAEITDFVQR